MPQEPDDNQIRALLQQAKTIAVVGLSDKPERSSYGVAAYMQQAGYRIIPVNPVVSEVLGEPAVTSLADIDEPIDIVNVFRRSELTLPVAEDAARFSAKAKANGWREPTLFWLQEGVVNDAACQMAQDAGMATVQDRCLAVAHKLLQVAG